MKELVWKLHLRLFTWAECVTVSGFLIKPTQTFQTHDTRNQEPFFHQWWFCGNVVSAACITLQNVLLLLLLLHHTAETQPVKMRLRNSAEPPRMLLEAAAVLLRKSRRFALAATKAASVVWISTQSSKECAEQPLAPQQWPGTSVLLCWCSLASSAVVWRLLFLCSSTLVPRLPSSVPPEKNQL